MTIKLRYRTIVGISNYKWEVDCCQKRIQVNTDMWYYIGLLFRHVKAGR